MSKEEIDDKRDRRILGRRDRFEPLRGCKGARGGLAGAEGWVGGSAGFPRASSPMDSMRSMVGRGFPRGEMAGEKVRGTKEQ